MVAVIAKISLYLLTQTAGWHRLQKTGRRVKNTSWQRMAGAALWLSEFLMCPCTDGQEAEEGFAPCAVTNSLAR